MENHLEHFLPKGQIEIEDSIFICDNSYSCETCSSFLYSLSETQIRAFIEGDDFTFDCSGIRIVIPASQENAKLFNVDGIQNLISEISHLKLDEEKEFIDWSKTTSILLVTPYFLNSDNGEVGLCLDILLKPYLDIFQVYFLEVRLEELRERYPTVQLEFRDELYQHLLKDEFLDKQISNQEIPSFLNHMEKFLSTSEIQDLQFMMCWGVFEVDRKQNGDWDITMLDLNKHSNYDF
jgi:hypothetical protein